MSLCKLSTLNSTEATNVFDTIFDHILTKLCDVIKCKKKNSSIIVFLQRRITGTLSCKTRIMAFYLVMITLKAWSTFHISCC
jgi:hypothetical protein